MGSIDPGTIMMALQTGSSLINNSRNAKAQARAIEASNRSRIQALEQQRAAEERKAREKLRHAQASRRAGFGAAGIGARGGSASALLTGLEKQVEDDLAEGRSLYQMRIDDLNRSAAQQRQQTLLDASSRRNQILFGLLQKSLPGATLIER